MVDWSAVPTGGRPAEWHPASATGRRKKRAAAMSELDKHPQEALAGSGTGTMTSASTVAMPTVGVAPWSPPWCYRETNRPRRSIPPPISQRLADKISDGEHTLYPSAFTDLETLIKTLGHERTHLMQKRIFGSMTKSSEFADPLEQAARQIEEEFWQYYLRVGRTGRLERFR